MERKIERQTLHVFLTGELDMKNATELKNTIDMEIDKKGIKTVVLHMGDLNFIDSSGLGVLLGRYKKLLPLGGKLKVADVPPHIFKIMEMSGLPKIIEFISDETA